jgi:hypothetical protein
VLPPRRDQPELVRVRACWAPQSTGKTALHFAAGQDDRGSEQSSVKIVQILLKVRALLRPPRRSR